MSSWDGRTRSRLDRGHGRCCPRTGTFGSGRYSADDIIRTQLTPDIDTARSIAAGWQQTLIDKGFRRLV